MGAAAYQVWRFTGTPCLEFLLIIFSYGTFSKKANVVLVSQLCICVIVHMYITICNLSL